MEEFHRLQNMANRVAFEIGTVKHGVAITLTRHDLAYFFAIWIQRKGGVESVELLASVTSEERLKAHAKGFIANLE